MLVSNLTQGNRQERGEKHPMSPALDKQHAYSLNCRGGQRHGQLGAKSCLVQRHPQVPSTADEPGNRAPPVGQAWLPEGASPELGMGGRVRSIKCTLSVVGLNRFFPLCTGFGEE